MFVKRVIPVLIILILLFSLSGCGSSDEEVIEEETTGTEEGDVGIGEETSSEYYIDVVLGSSLAIRKSPGTGGAEDVVERLARNEMVLVVDKHNNSVEENNYVWWEVVIPASQATGWTASAFLSETMLVEDEPATPGETPDDTEEALVGTFNPDDYVGSSRADFMNSYGYPDKTEIRGGIEFNHYKNLDVIVCYSRWLDKSTIIKVRPL